MKPYIKIDKEVYDTPVGGVLAKIWVSEYSGIKDPNIFVLKEEFDMLHNKTEPSFQTVCTPESFCEYPCDAPEEEGGFYRTRGIYIQTNTQDKFKEFLNSINERINKLCVNIEMLNDDTYKNTATISTNVFDIVFEYTNIKWFSNYIKITLPDDRKYLLIKNDPNVGKVFLDVCTPEDIFVYTDIHTDNIYRSNTVTICCSESLVDLIKDKLISLISDLAAKLV